MWTTCALINVLLAVSQLDFDEKCHFFIFSTIMITGLGFGLKDTGFGLGLGLEQN